MTSMALALLLTAQAAPAGSMAALDAEAKRAPPPTATIRYGTDDRRSGELRLPGGRGPFPVVFLVHGGCWSNDMGGMPQLRSLAEAFRRKGAAVWSVTYRRLGDSGAGWPGTFQDVAAAEDRLTMLAKRYPLDLTRVAFVGHSAGAQLAAWAAARPKLPAPWTATIRPRAVAMIDGPAGLAPFVGADAQVCGRPVIAPLMGGTPAQKPAEYRMASGAEHWPLGARQLFVRGELAPFMAPEIAAARASGDPVAVLDPPAPTHFDVVTPSSPNGARVVDWVMREAFGMEAGTQAGAEAARVSR